MVRRFKSFVSALLLGMCLPAVSSADVVTDWNHVMVSTLTATATSPQNAGRIAAIASAAVFDAVNGIDPWYHPYAVTETGPRGASQDAAAVQAAFVVLRTLFPAAQTAALTRQRDASIAAIQALTPAGVASGVAWGQFVAETLLAARSTDGFPTAGTPDPGGIGVGVWRPEAGAPAVTPWLAVMTPFAMPTPHHFRPAGPPALGSAAYAADFEEVKTIGRSTSAVRTAEQTVIAFYWTDNTIGHWNRVAAEVSQRHRRTLVDSARLFALLNIAMADAGVAVWDAKFHYKFWRPFSAIPLADSDGNGATAADPTWTPLLATPNHQEYPSGHGGLSGAAARVLAGFFRDDTSFTHRSDIAPYVARTHDSFSAAADEANNSRIYGGIHFRSAVRDGRIIGDQVGRLVQETLLRPLHGDPPPFEVRDRDSRD